MNIILSLTVFYIKNIFRFCIYSDFLLNFYYYLYLYFIYYYYYHTRNIAVKNMEVFLKKLNSLIN